MKLVAKEVTKDFRVFFGAFFPFHLAKWFQTSCLKAAWVLLNYTVMKKTHSKLLNNPFREFFFLKRALYDSQCERERYRLQIQHIYKLSINIQHNCRPATIHKNVRQHHYNRFHMNIILTRIVPKRACANVFWLRNCAFPSVDGRLECVILSGKEARALSLQGARGPHASFLFGSSRLLAAVPCPGEEFTVRACRWMMRSSCQSLISFRSAVRASDMLYYWKSGGIPKEGMPISKSSGQPVIYNY